MANRKVDIDMERVDSMYRLVKQVNSTAALVSFSTDLDPDVSNVLWLISDCMSQMINDLDNLTPNIKEKSQANQSQRSPQVNAH